MSKLKIAASAGRSRVSALVPFILVLFAVSGCKPSAPVTPPEATSSAPVPSPTSETAAIPEPSPQTAATPEVTPETTAAVQPAESAPVLNALSQDKAKSLLMHYMPWYETPAVRGQWGSHWTGHNKEHDPDVIKENGLPDIWSKFHPLIGLYDSTDPDVLECQLLQMKLAGINGVIVDWYGTYPTADYPAIHEATKAMFDACGKFGMKFAACYEDRSLELLVNWGKISPAEVPAQLAESLKWAAAEWFGAPQYFQFEGRPLLLNFGPIYVKEKEAWAGAVDACDPRPAFFALHHLWQDAGADGGFSWVHTEPFDGEPGEEIIVQRLTDTHNYRSADPLMSIPSVYPGFEDVYETSLHNLGRREGRTMRETLKAAMEGPWPVVQLVTWNDYGEGTVIEPTHEDGYAALEAVQDARRKELGEAFTLTAEYLRLPARLYALRKAGKAEKSELDQISQLLKAGQCQEAEDLLKSLDSSSDEAR